MTERSISDRHRAILRVINEKLDSSGFPPSVREIASAVGLASPSTVKHHLDALEAQGYLAREPGLPRALDLTDKARSELGIEAPRSRSSAASRRARPSRPSSTSRTCSTCPPP